MDQLGMGTHGDEQKGEVLQTDGVGKKELQEVEKSFDQLVKGVRAMLWYA
jgi:hypothetical protein